MAAARHLRQAVQRGLRGRCPACGRGPLLRRYVSPQPSCNACGEDLSPYGTADIAPYLVTFVVGLIFTPLAVALTMSGKLSEAGIWPILAAALLCALILLPRMKGAALGLLWALDVRS